MYTVPDKVINKKLYLKVKKEVYEQIPKHSAYRSGVVMKTYKDKGGKIDSKYESRSKGNLSKWFEEKWVNLTPYAEGLTKSRTAYKCGDTHPNQKNKSVCRPSVKVSDSTPSLAQNFSKAKIMKAAKLKNKGQTIIWSKL